MSRLARVFGRLANKPWSPSWNGLSLLAPNLAAAPSSCARNRGKLHRWVISFGRRLIGGPRAEGALLEVLNLRRRPGLPIVVVALAPPAEVDHLRPAEPTQPSVVILPSTILRSPQTLHVSTLAHALPGCALLCCSLPAGMPSAARFSLGCPKRS